MFSFTSQLHGAKGSSSRGEAAERSSFDERSSGDEVSWRECYFQALNPKVMTGFQGVLSAIICFTLGSFRVRGEPFKPTFSFGLRPFKVCGFR